MTSRAWAIAASVFGLATLGVFVAFNFLPDVAPVYAPGEAATYVSAFQRSTTLADLAQVFGDPADPAIIAAMDQLNTLDLYAFIPVYALFLIATAFMLGGNAILKWLAVLAVLVGAGGDVVETYQQLQLTADYQNATTHLPLIAPMHWVKYAGIGLNGVLVSALCLTAERKRWVLGIVGLMTLPIVAASYGGLVEPRAFTGAVALYWTALLVVSIIAAVRAKDAPA
ncbi:MAG: hypothetical protein M0D54_03605 [Hyphomonadaceae bacterium JAD_PAG50586_4]|nr:MAG: hypothetical protein M0D54_03605 [Hyphomonadaceae bacterium JAD_PAG50586_4]